MYLVTGTNGFVGHFLIKRLEEIKEKTRALVRKDVVSLFEKNASLELFSGDLLNLKDLMSAAQNIDIIIHLAGVTHSFDEKLYFLVNTQGTENLIHAAKGNNVKKIIYISTRAISPSGGAYSKSKLEAEKLIKASSINYTILRLSEVYGGNDKGIEQLINIIRRLPIVPIIGDGNYKLAPVYIKDVVDAIISVSKHNETDGKTYNIAGPETFTYNALIASICNNLHLKRLSLHVPPFFVSICAYVSFLLFKKIIVYPDQIARLISTKEEDIKMAKQDFGYKPMAFQEGLQLILERDTKIYG